MSLATPRRDELSPPLRFLAGGGDASQRILARDWAGHPLGPPDCWPETLKTALAAGLTHRLLAFSRRQSLDVRPVDVNALVAEMEELLRRTLGKQIGLAVELHEGAWSALTDAHQLQSALLNLAINARDAMPAGGRLTIESANTRLDTSYTDRFDGLEAGEFVVVCVSDTGVGMDADTVDRAFEPFFTTKPIGAGTGLGLSMIYGFAKQSGGHARIYSEVGKGTTVKLYLPRHETRDRCSGRARALRTGWRYRRGAGASRRGRSRRADAGARCPHRLGL